MVRALALLHSPFHQHFRRSRGRCGKNWLPGASPADPQETFAYPPELTDQFLVFNCYPAQQPFIEGDEFLPFSFYTNVTKAPDPNEGYAILYRRLDNDTTLQNLRIYVTEFGDESTSGFVGHYFGVLPFNDMSDTVTEYVAMFNVTARDKPYDISCRANYGSNSLSVNSSFILLPKNHSGSLAIADRRRGGFFVRNTDEANYTSFFPFGFFLDIDNKTKSWFPESSVENWLLQYRDDG
jgi:hypothetical protein